MKLNKLIRNDKQITFIIEEANEAGHLEESDVTAPEAPHPEMDMALAKLAPVVKRIMEYNTVAGIDPYGISLSYTKRGTRAAVIYYQRAIGVTGKSYKFSSVSFKIDDPSDDEGGQRECTEEESKAVIRVMEEGIRYAGGERQQTLLQLKDVNAEPKGGKDQTTDMFDGDEKGGSK